MASTSPAVPHSPPRRLAAAIILILAALGLGYLLLRPSQSPNMGRGLAVGSAAPDFSASTLGGQTLRLADLSGKWVVLNFWASWCGPCREEMPLFEAAWQQYRDRGLMVVGINLGESRVRVQSFLNQAGATFPVVIDHHDRLSRLYDVVPLPTTYLIGPDQRIHDQVTGMVSPEQMEAWIRRFL